MQRLAVPDDTVDVEYWEQLRSRIDVDLARSLLSEMHRSLLRRRLEKLESVHAAEAFLDSTLASDALAEQQQQQQDRDDDEQNAAAASTTTATTTTTTATTATSTAVASNNNLPEILPKEVCFFIYRFCFSSIVIHSVFFLKKKRMHILLLIWCRLQRQRQLRLVSHRRPLRVAKRKTLYLVLFVF